MANINDTLSTIMQIEGAMAVSIVDSNNGLMLGSQGKGIDLEYASAGNTELYHAKLKIMKVLGIKENIDDFLITLDTQYHFLIPVQHIEGVFIYAIFSKERSTLALARRRVHDLANELSIS
ncbi:MAG: hypothetical protein IJ566_06605 [Cardiobacteriaceae bacterium]|nr:hypothetical protein [Cardiobacteriaceae bacterium]